MPAAGDARGIIDSTRPLTVARRTRESNRTPRALMCSRPLLLSFTAERDVTVPLVSRNAPTQGTHAGTYWLDAPLPGVHASALQLVGGHDQRPSRRYGRQYERFQHATDTVWLSSLGGCAARLFYIRGREPLPPVCMSSYQTFTLSL